MTRMKCVLIALALVSAGCDRHEAPPQPTSVQPRVVASVPRALPSTAPQAPCITRESVGAVALAQLTGESASETAAIAAARRELERVLEIPEDYFASVQTAGDLVLLELWHRSAFLPENCTSKRCVKCRTVAYDAKLRRVVSTKVWEPGSD